ncbi:endonuclease domain-containing protein [Streptomyces olivaceoviridis]|uniref:endonuclease domain-containing protein n=1 Tax=Streptomyces olivaceoviridis TaxID=1921 RepID=UPI003570AA69
MHLWPPPPARTPSLRRLRAALVDALGADCHLCGLYPGAMVDHDHQTGQVRGLLCAFCKSGAGGVSARDGLSQGRLSARASGS